MIKDKELYINDVSNLFYECDIPLQPKIEFNDSTYDCNPEDFKDNWLYIAFLAFKKLKKEKIKVGTFVTIGTGPAIDAIGAAEIFSPELVVLTDINPNVIDIAYRNFLNYSLRKKIKFNTLEGDLCEPLIKNSIKADLIYANLPNIPNDEINLLNMETSTFINSEITKDVPAIYKNYLLSTQYKFLIGAKECLMKDGFALLNIGARVSVDLLNKLFNDCGYVYKEIVCGFKLQTEAKWVLSGYKQFEQNDLEFDFYLYEESIKQLENKAYIASDSGELRNKLKEFRINAKDAYKLDLEGKRIGHIVQVIKALPQKSIYKN